MKRVKLVTWPCTTGTASTIVGERHEVGSELFVPVMLTPYRWVLCCHFTIPEGFHAVVHRCGAYAGSWQPGCHCASPWTKIQYMVPKHYATFDTPVKEVATKDNVMVKIDVSVVFRIKVRLGIGWRRALVCRSPCNLNCPVPYFLVWS